MNTPLSIVSIRVIGCYRGATYRGSGSMLLDLPSPASCDAGIFNYQ